MKVITFIFLFIAVNYGESFLEEPSVQVEGEGWNIGYIDRLLKDGILSKVNRNNLTKRILDLIKNNNVQDPKAFIEACNKGIQSMIGCHRLSFESKLIESVFETCMESLVKTDSVEQIENIQEMFDAVFENNMDNQLSVIKSLFSLNEMQNPSKLLKSLKSSVNTLQLAKSKNIASLLENLSKAMSTYKLKNPSEILDAFENTFEGLFGKQLSSVNQNLLIGLAEDLVKLLRFKTPVKAIESLNEGIKKLIGDRTVSSDILAALIRKAVDEMVKNNSPKLTDKLISSIRLEKPKNDEGPKSQSGKCDSLLKYLVNNRSFKPSNLVNRVQDGCSELVNNQGEKILENVKDLFQNLLNPFMAKRSTSKIEVLFSLADALFEVINSIHPVETLQSLSKMRKVLVEMSPELITKFLREFQNSMKKNKLTYPSEIIDKIDSVLKNLIGDNLRGINENTLLSILQDLLRLFDLPNKIEGLSKIEDVLRNTLIFENNKLSSIPVDGLAQILKSIVNEILSNRSIQNVLSRLQNSSELKKLLNSLGIGFKLTTTTSSSTTSTSTTSTTTKPTTRSTTTTGNPHIVNYCPISNFLNQGYRIVYEDTYKEIFRITTLESIRSRCNQNSMICVGGAETGSQILRVVACGNCLSILVQTPFQQTRLVGSVYWHYTPDSGFGFSPTSSIENIGDTDPDNNQRLEFYLGLGGGYRLGNLRSIITDQYKRYILLRI